MDNISLLFKTIILTLLFIINSYLLTEQLKNKRKICFFYLFNIEHQSNHILFIKISIILCFKLTVTSSYYQMGDFIYHLTLFRSYGYNLPNSIFFIMPNILVYELIYLLRIYYDKCCII